MPRAGGCFPLLAPWWAVPSEPELLCISCMAKKKKSPFIEKGTSGQLGAVSSIRKLRSWNLLIKVSSEKQVQQIMKIKSIGGIPVSVSPHRTLNFTKGVISCGELFNTPVEQITKDLNSQGVTNVQRITLRKDGQLLNTKHLIFTFHSPKLPGFIKAGCMNLPFRPYIPNPLRCFKYQRFGHSKASCHGTLTYARCAEGGHESSECTAPEKCVNCKGQHTSFSRLCPIKLNIEKEVVSEKVTKGISYIQAKQSVKSRATTSGLTYATATKSILETKSTQMISVNLPSDSSSIKKSYVPTEMCSRSTESFLAAFSPKISAEKISHLEKHVSECASTSPVLTGFKHVQKRKKNQEGSKIKTKPKQIIPTSFS
ncbi:uncharacterized protein LOC129962782 [Argiope bruennichi]|uniref:uncharacterized protein LOC129962782 n=1 Tax=Argiope bruennichi TaxID=94029 RepID=UPI00249529F5|nr:uncharacterized protein LOC129962782 [Argiope bruennichi]